MSALSNENKHDRYRSVTESNLTNKIGSIVVATSLLLSGAAEIIHRASEPKSRTVSMLVRSFDNPSTIAQRAEKRFGTDPGDYNVQTEALRLAGEYGTLHAGDRLQVHVK